MTDLAVTKAKRVDTDDVAESVIEVIVPDTLFGQRMQLTDVVRAQYPDADFGHSPMKAASFLDNKR